MQQEEGCFKELNAQLGCKLLIALWFLGVVGSLDAGRCPLKSNQYGNSCAGSAAFQVLSFIAANSIRGSGLTPH